MNFIRSYGVPIGMVLGILLSKILLPLAPYMGILIAVVLFFAYCKIDFKQMKITKMHWIFIAIQYVGGLLVFYILKHFDMLLASGAMLLFITPTAAAAAVITNTLDGDVNSLTTYNILSNIFASILCAVYFSMAIESSDLSIWNSILHIGKEIFALMAIPLVVAFIIYRYTPMLHQKIQKIQPYSFVIWLFTMMVAVGKTFNTIKLDEVYYKEEISLAIMSLIVCIMGFLLGRIVGIKNGKPIAGMQALGQKNTVLAIWMAHSFFAHPIISIAPGAYIIWQNLFNSWQFWRQRKKTKKQAL